MKLVKLLVSALLLAVLYGCAAVGVAPRKTNEGPLQSQLSVRVAENGVHVGQDLGKAVYVNVVDSPRLTNEFSRALTTAGIQVVDSRDQSTVVYELDGLFQATRRTGRIGRIRLGVYAEQPDSLVARRDRPLADSTDASNLLLFGDPDGSPGTHLSYAQSAGIVLKKIASEGETTTSIEVELPSDQAMQPVALFQAGLDALCKAIGLPERSLLIAQPQVTH